MTTVEETLGATSRVGSAEALRSRGVFRRTLPVLGPAFVAAIAYVDPGNFATNFSGGARFGYLLLWVIVVANVMAMVVQDLSAKLGLATGQSLPQLCRSHFPRGVSRALWVQAEIVAMATDLAEVVGGAIALDLLFGLPLLVGGLVTGAVAFALLGLQRSGHRPFELAISGLLGVIALGFLVDLLSIHIDGGAAAHGLDPTFSGSDSILLAAGIIGATVMPHAIYLHSSMTKSRIRTTNTEDKRFLLRRQRVDIGIAMTLSGLVNVVMLLIAAALFFGQPGIDSNTLAGIHSGLRSDVGSGAALVFALALLASGFASSGVGTLAGQVVMQGFIGRSIPLLVRRAVTLAPAIIVLGVGLDPTRALVLSQVVLSFGIPCALIPLVLLTSRRDVMGGLVNHRGMTILGGGIAGIIVALNMFLILQPLV